MVSGYHASKRSLGPLWIRRLCSLSSFFICFSPKIHMLCNCSSKMTKDHFLENRYATKWPLCADVPLSPHSFIHSFRWCHVCFFTWGLVCFALHYNGLITYIAASLGSINHKSISSCGIPRSPWVTWLYSFFSGTPCAP